MNREAFKALPRAGSSSRSASRTDRDDGQLEHTKQSESKRPKRSEVGLPRLHGLFAFKLQHLLSV